MEILEIISCNVDLKSNILDVTFRTIEDSDDVQRVDRIDYSDVEEYGYDILSQDFDIFGDFEDDEELENDYYSDNDFEIDEEELITFLNEYYMVNPSSLPKATF
jgi:hypothetical protein